MKMEDYISEIRLELTGNLLELEIDDKTLEAIVNKALREMQRYISATKLITVPYYPCIDLKDTDVCSVSRVFRVEGYGDAGYYPGTPIDPFYDQRWMAYSNGGNLLTLSNFVANYGAWNTMLQIRNTTSTDLAFREDELNRKLYINTTSAPGWITIEYIPKFKSIEEVTSPFWEDKLVRLSVALVKQTIGKIRSRYTHSNAVWQQDGERLLDEANAELAELRAELKANNQLVYVYD